MLTLYYNVMVLAIVGLPPCEDVLNALGDLLSAKCYEDWFLVAKLP